MGLYLLVVYFGGIGVMGQGKGKTGEKGAGEDIWRGYSEDFKMPGPTLLPSTWVGYWSSGGIPWCRWIPSEPSYALREWPRSGCLELNNLLNIQI